jgi:anti-sigma B factor antagonist
MAEPSLLNVLVERRAARSTVRLSGELDMAGEGQLREVLDRLLAEHRPLVVDLTALSFCDVPGVRVLVAFARTAARSGLTVEIRGASPPVRRVLDLTRTRTLLGVR